MAQGAETPVHVVQPDEGRSYWQPVPANGHAEVRVAHSLDPRVTSLATGIQVIAPGGHIREHVHPNEDELLFFFEGEGVAMIDGIEHRLGPGTTVYVGRGHRHSFHNHGAGELRMCWVMVPGGPHGLDDFFARIGRPRTPGEPAPDPFPRPTNTREIEAATVFRHDDGG